MTIKFAAGVNPEAFQNVFDGNGNVIGTLLPGPMSMTKEIFEAIPNGAAFRVVTTHIQNVYEPMKRYLKLVCKKSDVGIDWAIYCHTTEKSIDWILQHGDKVHGEETIRSVCPCTDEVFQLYRK